MNSIIIGLVFLAISVSSQSCPSFSCDSEELKNANLCYKHSRDDPVSSIKLSRCSADSAMICNTKGEFAWIDS